jgi:hypothetical protein
VLDDLTEPLPAEVDDDTGLVPAVPVGALDSGLARLAEQAWLIDTSIGIDREAILLGSRGSWIQSKFQTASSDCF